MKTQINYPAQNPYTRKHLIAPKSLYTSTVTLPKYNNVHDHYIYHSRAQHYPLNIWSFHDDHNSSFNPISQSRHLTQISSFQKSMMIGNSTSRKNQLHYNYQNHIKNNPELKYKGLDENPFLRKNLLITRQKIQDQIQKDRNRLNYQNWSESYEISKRNSRRQSSYGNAQDKYTYNSNSEINNGSMMMNLLDKPALEGHLVTTLGQNFLSRGTSSKQRQSPEKRQQKEHKQQKPIKQQIIIRGRKYFKQDVIRVIV